MVINSDKLFAQIWDSRIANVQIHPDDEMHLHLVQALERDPIVAHGEYLLTGAEIAALILQTSAWLGIDLARSGRMLDYASGYGRSTRHLVKSIPSDRIWVSEIQAEALAHQSKSYGVHSMPAAGVPTDLRAPVSFDFVSVISLLTHVPRKTFAQWLNALLDLLAPGGALLFTTHALDLSLDTADSEFVFDPYAEHRFETPDGYGNTYVSREYVEEQITAVGAHILAAVPKALTGYQDVFVVSRNRDRPLDSLKLSENPRIVVDVCRRNSEGMLEIGGWAAWKGKPVESVVLYGDDTRLDSAALGYQRPDLVEALGCAEAKDCGWVFRSAKSEVDPEIVTAAGYGSFAGVATQSVGFGIGGQS